MTIRIDDALFLFLSALFRNFADLSRFHAIFLFNSLTKYHFQDVFKMSDSVQKLVHLSSNRPIYSILFILLFLSSVHTNSFYSSSFISIISPNHLYKILCVCECVVLFESTCFRCVQVGKNRKLTTAIIYLVNYAPFDFLFK